MNFLIIESSELLAHMGSNFLNYIVFETESSPLVWHTQRTDKWIYHIQDIKITRNRALSLGLIAKDASYLGKGPLSRI